MNVNKVLLAGRLTRDIELTKIPDGQQVARNGLAINRKLKTRAGRPPRQRQESARRQARRQISRAGRTGESEATGTARPRALLSRARRRRCSGTPPTWRSVMT